MKCESRVAWAALIALGILGVSVVGCGSETSEPEDDAGQPTSSGSAGSTASVGAAGTGGTGAGSGAGSSSGGTGGSGSGEGGSGSGEGGSDEGTGGSTSGAGGSDEGAGGSSSGAGGSGSGTGGGDPGAVDFRLYGYATTGDGTTGGKGGQVVSVSSLDALRREAARDGAVIIQITGKISGSGDDVDVTSDKTLVGVGSSGELEGIGLNLRRASNIIVRNLKIHHVLASSGNGDGIHMDESHNVWIDHCELWAESPAVNSDKDKYDGLIDATHESSNITISWSYLHDHWKGMLVGSSDKDNSDRRITFHHNRFRNVNSRVPSYRGGNGHVFNNYFEDVPASGVNSRVGACLRVEGNHFYKVKNPITTLDSPAGGTHRIDNLFEQTTGTQESGQDCSWTAPYEYPLDRAAAVKALVLEHAGVGKTDPLANLP
ncbi:right-handed parallel beta-helix repeat-containing protein [Sorangium sp. So ce327]|uniref:pectate lyase family protein n=1 Tax=Sorangium sp. So ce327 TaxID=3133301 RepID=UPI003F5FB994